MGLLDKEVFKLTRVPRRYINNILNRRYINISVMSCQSGLDNILNRFGLNTHS